jgi:predicted dehydrogenase
VKLAIIGCGLIGQKRAAAAAKLGVPVVAVADVDPRRAAELAQKTKTARVVADWREAVHAADVDAVIVATTHDALAPIGLAALEAGKHLLVEKPAGRCARELEPVAAAAAREGRVGKVGFNHRFHPAFCKSREIVDSGALGPLSHVRARYGHGGRLGYEKEWRMNPAVSGGGEMIDQGMHLIDLARWFLGDFARIDGHVATYYWDCPADDNCFLSLRTSGGQTAWLHASCTEWKNLFCFEIFGRHGKLQIDGLGGSYGTERLTFYRMLPELGPPETTSWEYPFSDLSWQHELANFFAAIEGRQPVCGSLADALAALRIVGAIYGESSR